MHKSSYDKMRNFVSEYLQVFRGRKIKILDIGSSNIYGSYRDIFEVDDWTYVGADIEPGDNVDVVLKDIYQWNEFADGGFDVVISCQVFEHIEFIWRSILELRRVLKPGGICCIIAPSSGPEHRYPLDCWRIYPDGMKALAKYAGLEIIKAETDWECSGYDDTSADWRDTILIAKRPDVNAGLIQHADIGQYRIFPEFCSVFVPKLHLNEAWSGHIPFAHWLINEYKPETFVELGTYRGESYFAVCQSVDELRLPSRCFAVDNWQGDQHMGRYEESVYEKVKARNEDFYSSFSTLLRMEFDRAIDNFRDDSIDLLHVDGLHTYEAVKHDFDSWLCKVKPGGIILFHDICCRHNDYGVYKLWNELVQSGGEHFSFIHSWGLGVWRKPGGQKPASGELEKMLRSNDQEFIDRVRNSFTQQAALLSAKYLINQERDKHIQRLREYELIKSKYEILCSQYERILNSREDALPKDKSNVKRASAKIADRLSKFPGMEKIAGFSLRVAGTISPHARRQNRIEELRSKITFDEEYYLYCNPDVKEAGVDPFTHFAEHGMKEGRLPYPDFNPDDPEPGLKTFKTKKMPVPKNLDKKQPGIYKLFRLLTRFPGLVTRGIVYNIRLIKTSIRQHLSLCDTKIYLDQKYPGLTYPAGIFEIPSLETRLKKPRIIPEKDSRARINVLLPTLDPALAFAGYIAIIKFMQILVNKNYKLRIIICQDKEITKEWLLEAWQEKPDVMELIKNSELANIYKPLPVRKSDIFISYSGWEAITANALTEYTDKNEFFFFIQEYEPVFHENCSFSAVLQSAYHLPHIPIFNSKPLLDYFKYERLGIFQNPDRHHKFMLFKHAITTIAPSEVRNQKIRKLLFYARPEKHAARNLFSFGILCLKQAIAEGYLEGDWEFWGIGTMAGEYSVDLGMGNKMKIISKLPYHDYVDFLTSFDVGFSLMMAPHPSLLPYEMLMAGLVVVTNNYVNRNRDFFANISENIISADLCIQEMADAINRAAVKACQPDYHPETAVNKIMEQFSPSWEESFNNDFLSTFDKFTTPDK